MPTPSYTRFAFFALIMLSPALVHSQTNQAKPESIVVGDTASETPQQTIERAWRMLADAANDSKHADIRIQALAALSTMKANSHAEKMIADALHDSQLEVRTAAVLAAGKVQAPSLVAPVRRLLDDPEPQVAFAAATTLWKDFKDRTGEDIIAAVADGERKATPGLLHGAGHDISKTMRNPSTLARLGAQQSAGLVLGPFGFSLLALEYVRKSGSDTARIEALELLSEQKTEATKQEMLHALSDKDAGVRAAAAKSLGDYHTRLYANAVSPVLDDSKLPVRLTAAAAYINCTEGSALTLSRSSSKNRK